MRNTITIKQVGVLAALLGFYVTPSMAGDATITCTTPTNNVARTVKTTITIGDSVTVIDTEITPGMTAKQKATKIGNAIDAHAVPNFTVVQNPDPSFTITALPKGATVEFDPGKTGELSDKIEVGKLALLPSVINFEGHLDPITYSNQPAIFTAGMVTDVGVLTEHVSAQELNFQTDGPIVCQALFQRLAPRAPQYGAQINYAGDRLEIYFDPAYTVVQGGIIFGTNSRSEGCNGSVVIPTDPPNSTDCNGNGVVDSWDIASAYSQDANANGIPDECESSLSACDTNCDGSVNLFDIDSFVGQLGTGAAGCSPGAGDTNDDGSVNLFDIDGFVACLAG